MEFATALNIGGGGVLLAMRRSAPVGSSVLLEIPHSPALNESDMVGSSHQFEARVVRATANQKLHILAAEFAAPVGTPSLATHAGLV